MNISPENKRNLIKGGGTLTGALLGLGATRALIPEEDRDLVNQGLGTAAGGALGYQIGSHLADSTKTTAADYGDALREAQEPNEETRKMLLNMGLGDEMRIPGYTKGEVKRMHGTPQGVQLADRQNQRNRVVLHLARLREANRLKDPDYIADATKALTEAHKGLSAGSLLSSKLKSLFTQ